MRVDDAAALTREILENDPNVIACVATPPRGVQVHVRDLRRISTLRMVYGHPLEFIEVTGED